MGKTKHKKQQKSEDKENFEHTEQINEEKKQDSVFDAILEAALGVEEQKVEKTDEIINEKIPMGRRNSRFMSEDEKQNNSSHDVLKYRPEFGNKSNKANEKIWQLMSSYIGAD